MSLPVGLVVVLLLAVIAVTFYRIWSQIDLFPCPNCESNDVEPARGVDGAFNRCLSCHHEWRDEEEL